MDSLDKRNADLEEKIKATDLPKAVETLIKDAKRGRRRFVLLAITVVFDVLLTFGFGYITIRTHNLASQAESNSAAIVRSCEVGNESRANNKKLWEYILGLPPTSAPSVERDQRIAEFKAFVDKTFAQRDCSNLKADL